MNFACNAVMNATRSISRQDHSVPAVPVSVFQATGRATLYSYVINHRPHPAFDGPYAIAVVELEEGPRMMTNIVETPQTPEALQLDMPLQVTFTKITQKGPRGGTAEISLPHFKPVEE